VEPRLYERRRTYVRSLLAIPLLLTAVLGTASCGADAQAEASGESPATTRAVGWQPLSRPPVSPRLGAATAWTGTEALFIGGDTSKLLPPNADCFCPAESARDGAAYDPRNDTWRPIAPAPVPITGYTGTAVLGDTVWLLTAGRLLSYDASDDAWTTHRLPTTDLSGDVVAYEGAIIVVTGEQTTASDRDQRYDPATKAWSPLPADPLAPAWGRTVTATPRGLVLTGQDLVDQPGSEKPSLLRAAILPPGSDRWRLLPDSDQLGTGLWSWTGRHLVNPDLSGADGGEVNGYGRWIPNGGILDPATGTWSRLPSAPGESSGGWRVQALDGPLAAYAGWIYDDRDQTWTLLPRPEGAPARPGSAVWAADALVVLGGADEVWAEGSGELSGEAWIWRSPELALTGTGADRIGDAQVDAHGCVGCLRWLRDDFDGTG
jgi:hypothetical protein